MSFAYFWSYNFSLKRGVRCTIEMYYRTGWLHMPPNPKAQQKSAVCYTTNTEVLYDMVRTKVSKPQCALNS